MKDENAFLFLIKCNDKAINNKCPLLFELDKNRRKNHVKRAICCMAEYGPIFGAGGDISIRDQCDKQIPKEGWDGYGASFAKKRSYIYPPEIDSICGGNITADHSPGNNYFQVMDYHVFKVIS